MVLLLFEVIQLFCGFVVLESPLSPLSPHSQSGVSWLLYMLLPLHGIGASFPSSGLGLCYGNMFSKKNDPHRGIYPNSFLFLGENTLTKSNIGGKIPVYGLS